MRARANLYAGRVTCTWQRTDERVEADVKVDGLRGRWVRVYAGASNADRPRYHRWTMGEMEGVTLRFRRGMPPRGGCRVFGVQWRPGRGAA
jgi:hypothetical protein